MSVASETSPPATARHLADRPLRPANSSRVARAPEARLPLGTLRRDSHARAETEQNLTQDNAGLSSQKMDTRPRPTLTDVGKMAVVPVTHPPLEPREHQTVAAKAIDDRGNELSRAMKL